MRLSARHLQDREGTGTAYGMLKAGCTVAMLGRIATAVVGGYALTTAVTLLLARVLPFSPLDRFLWSMMASFALYAAVIIWSFAARALLQVWLSLSIGTLGCAVLAWLARGMAG